MRHLALLLGSATPLACAPALTPLTDADASRAGAFGDDGAFGAALLERAVRARGDAVVDVDIVVPTDADGARAPGPFAPVLLVQGGLVDVARYHWLAAHMATRGYIVVAPHHVGDLAFFSQGDGVDALAALRRQSDRSDDVLAGAVDDVPALAIGHSLGGVVAHNAFENENGTVSHLVLLASLPNPNLTELRQDGRVLSLAGANDGSIGVDEVKEGAASFAAPTTVAVVAGLTHYALTDDPTPDDLAKDGESDVDVKEARRRALTLVDAMLADLVDDGTGTDVLNDPTAWDSAVTP
jgi:hypothetical protein